jgi:hypothetical protein
MMIKYKNQYKVKPKAVILLNKGALQPECIP